MGRALAIAAAIAALGIAACGDEDEEAAPSQSEPAAESVAPSDAGGGEDGNGRAGAKREQRAERPGITVATGDSQFGEILFDSDDRAIYLFDKEKGSKSECYGECAAAWPPVLTKGEPQADGAVKQKLLGTTQRDDGSTQVTYAGHPLYYYVDDPPGQVLCHNVAEFGGLWLVLQASGEAVS